MSNIAKRFLTSLLAGGIFFGSYLYLPTLYLVLLLVIFAEILIFEWPRLIDLTTVRGWVVTLVYPGLPMASLLYLYFMYYNVHKLIAIYPFLISWAYDMAAYLTGTMIGRHHITPRTSPGKTWEGLFGGLVAVLIVNGILFYRTSGLVLVAVASLLITLIAFAGDFFESRL